MLALDALISTTTTSNAVQATTTTTTTTSDAAGANDDEWGELVAVAVVRRPGATCDEAQLRAHLAARLARYKLPRRWFWLDALPKTALGKVRKADLAVDLQQARDP